MSATVIPMKNHPTIESTQVLWRKADASAEDAERFYTQVGQELAWHKANLPEGVTWKVFVMEHLGRSQQRADELIRIGSGKTTVAKVRAEKAESMRRTRAKPTPRGVGSERGGKVVEENPLDPTAEDVKDNNRAALRDAAAEKLTVHILAIVRKYFHRNHRRTLFAKLNEAYPKDFQSSHERNEP